MPDITKLTVWNSWGPNGSTTQYVKDNTCVTSWGTTYYQNGGSWIACPSGTQIYSNPNLWENCGDKWASGYWTTQSGNPYCTQWMNNSYIQDGKWLSACTGDYILFSKTSTTGIYQCLKACTSTYSLQTSSGEWVAACPVTSYIDTSTSKCVAWPAGMQVYSDPKVWENWGDKCTDGFWTSQNNRPLWTKCMDNTFLQDGKWISSCSSDYILHAKTSQSTVTEWLKAWTPALPYLTSSNEWVASWPITSYIDTATSKCVACPAGTQIYSNPYLWENWGNKWANGACTTQNNLPVWTSWMSNSYKQEGKWLSAWSGDYGVFSQTTDAGIYQCLKTCTTALPYQTTSKECVAICPTTAYLDTANSKWVDWPTGMKVYSNPSLCENWGDKCTDGFWTTQNNLLVWTKWMSNSYKQEGKWLSAWSGDYVVFSQTTDAGIYQWLKSCTAALPYKTSSKECVASCPNTAYLDTVNAKWVDWPTGMKVYSNPSLCENCGDKWTDGYWTTQSGNSYCTKCMDNSFIQEGKWISAWTGDYTLYSKTSQSTVMQCLKTWPSSLPYTTSSNECVSTCPVTSYLNTATSKCINCPTGMQVYSNPSLCENCGDKWTDGFWTTQNNLLVWTKWMDNSYIQEGKCLAACTGDYKFFIKTSQNSVYQWLKTCPSSAQYHLPTKEWVQAWSLTSYVDTVNMVWVDWTTQFSGWDRWVSITDSLSSTTTIKWKQWGSTAPYFSSDLKTWVSSCSTGETLVQTSSYGYWLKCPSAWTSWSILDDKIKWSSWASGYNYDESSGSWSSKWPLLKYAYNSQCVSSWPSGYSAQLDTGKWVACSISGWVKCTSLGSYISWDQWAAGRIKSGSLATGYKCDTICDVSNTNYWTSNGVWAKVTGYKDA